MDIVNTYLLTYILTHSNIETRCFHNINPGSYQDQNLKNLDKGKLCSSNYKVKLVVRSFEPKVKYFSEDNIQQESEKAYPADTIRAKSFKLVLTESVSM